MYTSLAAEPQAVQSQDLQALIALCCVQASHLPSSLLNPPEPTPMAVSLSWLTAASSGQYREESQLILFTSSSLLPPKRICPFLLIKMLFLGNFLLLILNA